MKALKALVIFMTLLLVAGLALLGYGLATKVRPGTHAAAPAALPPAAGFGAVAVPLPAGAQVEQMAVAGDRVVLRIATGAGTERLVVLDPVSGTVAGSFVLSPAAQ